jgi:hypothetical protein
MIKGVSKSTIQATKQISIQRSVFGVVAILNKIFSPLAIIVFIIPADVNISIFTKLTVVPRFKGR